MPNSIARAMLFLCQRTVEERKSRTQRQHKARNENEWKKERRDHMRTKVWEEAERTKQDGTKAETNWISFTS
jgi:hypothetical protein